MTLPVVPGSSMSFSQINTELGLTSTATISLNDSAVRTLAGVGASPATIAITNLSGKSNQFSFTISSNQTNANLRTLAINAGWNQSSKLVATINSGVYISSNSTGTPALTVSGSFPGGVSLINGGVIVGMGSNGRNGSTNTPDTGSTSGGLALSVSSAISITNNNIIAGGGGGGGGGGSVGSSVKGTPIYNPGGGGGGGQSSQFNSSGGTGLFADPAYSGGAGTISGAGGGGPGNTAYGGGSRSGNGGAGGSWGSTGSSGSNATGGGGVPVTSGPSSGLSGGGAVSGNSNITWVAFGTRYGGIS